MVDGAHESNEFVRDDPVKVSIFDSFVVLILFVVKLSEIVPAEIDSNLEALQAVEDRAAIGAIAITGVSKRSKAGLVWLKGGPCHLSRLFEHHNHEGTHQVGCICLLVEDV